MRVLLLSKACIVGIYQRKLEEIARLGVDLLALVPPSWKDERGETRLERAYTSGYRLEVLPIVFNGSFHLHFYRGLGGQIHAFQPDLVHIDEEPYNLSAWQALYHARQAGARSLFFTWQNLPRRYPPPFSWGEHRVLSRVNAAIAGTEGAARVCREKGYSGSLAVIPQFGVDPELFCPAPTRPDRPFTVGYIGRLVEEKGIHILLEAASALQGHWRLRLVGSGPYRSALLSKAERLGIVDRLEWEEWLPSTAMPAEFRRLDALVLPSLTRPNWMEQFGRVLVEAMSAGVPVIGSSSGAIPDVIGDAGLIVPEGDVPALTAALARLQADSSLARNMSEAGRARVLDHFTNQQVAADTVSLYRQVLDPAPDRGHHGTPSA